MSDVPPTVPEDVQKPVSAADFVRRGWTLHVQNEHDKAAADFRRAIELDPNSVEGYYGLGMTLKMAGEKQEAQQAFEKTLELIQEDALADDPARATMLRHLARTHMSMLEKGRDLNPEP